MSILTETIYSLLHELKVKWERQKQILSFSNFSFVWWSHRSLQWTMNSTWQRGRQRRRAPHWQSPGSHNDPWQSCDIAVLLLASFYFQIQDCLTGFCISKVHKLARHTKKYIICFPFEATGLFLITNMYLLFNNNVNSPSSWLWS